MSVRPAAEPVEGLNRRIACLIVQCCRRTPAVSRRAMGDALAAQTTLGAVGSSAMLGARPGTDTRGTSPGPQGVGEDPRGGDTAPRDRGSLGWTSSCMPFVLACPLSWRAL